MEAEKVHATIKTKLNTKLAEAKKVSCMKIATQGGKNTILQEEIQELKEELKEDRLVSKAQIKTPKQLQSATQSASKRKQVSVNALSNYIV